MKGPRPLIYSPPRGAESGPLAVPSLSAAKIGFFRVKGSNAIASRFLRPIKAMEDSSVSLRNDCAAISGTTLFNFKFSQVFLIKI